MSDEADFDELMKLYTSEEEVRSAKLSKDKADEPHEDIGVLVKDYPKIQRELDLHGMTGMEAQLELQHFVDRCIQQRIMTIRVITGKGLHSAGFKSVLPEVTERKLGEMRRAGKVLVFKRDKTGGSFTVYLVA